MAYSAATGIAGLEGRHAWRGIIDLNNHPDAFPNIKLTKITGLRSHGEAENNTQNNTGRQGVRIYPSQRRSKTVTYEGIIRAKTLESLRGHSNLLRYATGDINSEGQMVVSVPAGGVSHFYWARVLAYDEDDEQTHSPQEYPGPYQREFVLSLFIKDSRYFENIDHSVAAESGVTQNCAHDGSQPTDPSFFVNGPVAGDIVIQRGDGRKLVFADLFLGGGTLFTVSFRDRRAYLGDGTDLTGKLSVSQSDWWDEGVEGFRPRTLEAVAVTGNSWSCHWNNAN